MRGAAERLHADDEEQAAEDLHARGWTDGLPIVVPTPERIHRMLTWVPDLEPGDVLGAVAPNNGIATVEKVAINAVMAGCRPEYLPVVLAAVEAVIDPRFDLGAVQATTHGVSPLIVVNGPARRDCGPLASGTGALGPGHRANLTIGRALRLVLWNIGGGRAGSGDMAQLGHGGKLTACLAEAEERSPFEPLHVSLGHRPEDSVVTVLGTEAPHSVLCVVDPDEPDPVRRLSRLLGAALANVGANNVHLGKGAVGVVLNPEHARVFAGMTRREVQEAIHAHAWEERGLLRELDRGLVPEGDPADPVHVVADPGDILLLVAGGGGQYSAILHTWAAGMAGSLPVSRPIRIGGTCSIV